VALPANRKCVFNAGMTVLYKLRFTIERIFAWEDKFKRLLLRFETKQIRHLGFKLIAFTLINLREFCGG
jgi:transposase